MKATIEFQLPEEHHEHAVYMSAQKIACAWVNFGNKLRTIRKHGEHGPEAEKVIDTLWDVFCDQNCDLPDEVSF